MSPILVRPVREQLEHDRVIRLLQQDLSKRKVEVGINPGTEQNASVGAGSRKEYPDAVLYAVDKGKKVIGVVEVETGESVNHLEAMAQWAHLAKLKVPFHLYVPMGSVDVARRLSTDYRIQVTEIWSYHQVGDQFRFTLIHPVGSRGRGGPAPRTVSVASIRVARLPEIEPVEEPPPPPPASEATPVVARRVVAAKAKAEPPAQAPAPSAKGAKGKAAAAAPAPAPARAVPPPAKVAAAKGTAAGVSPRKVTLAKASPVKVSPVRASSPRAATPQAAATKRPASKSLARPAAKSAAKSSARTPQPRGARPAARPAPKPARAQRPKAGVKAAAKAPGRRK